MDIKQIDYVSLLSYLEVAFRYFEKEFQRTVELELDIKGTSLEEFFASSDRVDLVSFYDQELKNVRKMIAEIRDYLFGEKEEVI